MAFCHHLIERNVTCFSHLGVACRKSDAASFILSASTPFEAGVCLRPGTAGVGCRGVGGSRRGGSSSCLAGAGCRSRRSASAERKARWWVKRLGWRCGENHWRIAPWRVGCRTHLLNFRMIDASKSLTVQTTPPRIEAPSRIDSSLLNEEALLADILSPIAPIPRMQRPR